MATPVRTSIEEFLALPETKPYLELMDGEVIEKAMPNEAHGVLVNRLLFLLNVFHMSSPTFRVRPEVRHIDRNVGWIYLPDVAVTLYSRVPKVTRDPVEVAPDFAIEVLSPGDRPGLVTRKVASYIRAGTTLVWLVDPEARAITAFQRGADPLIASGSATLSAAPVLPGFDLDVAALFSVLDFDS